LSKAFDAKAFDAKDIDDNGYIEIEEFGVAYKSIAELEVLKERSPKAHELFCQIDRDEDGRITLDEVCEFFTDDDVFRDGFLQLFDVNDNGFIDTDEFWPALQWGARLSPSPAYKWAYQEAVSDLKPALSSRTDVSLTDYSAYSAYSTPRMGYGSTGGDFTIEIEEPPFFTDRSGADSDRSVGELAGLGGHRDKADRGKGGKGDVWARPKVGALTGPGFHINTIADEKKEVKVSRSEIRSLADPGRPLMPYGCCTPLGLTAFMELFRVMMPGGSSMEDEAELQEVFTVLRLVQALFLSAPMLYFQVLIIMSIGPQRAYHHHLILILSAGVSFLSLFIALTSFVLNPATDRPCRVRGWLISSKALLLGSALYFASDMSLRALAVGMLGYAIGSWAWIVPPALAALWLILPFFDYFFGMLSSGSMPTRRSDVPLLGIGDKAGGCRRPVRVWLDTALRYFAFVVAPPVLDGLGTNPVRLGLEGVLSTALCVGAIGLGCWEGMPHPQRDPWLIHVVLQITAAAVVTKLAVFGWAFFPAMTGMYPVLGVSHIIWFNRCFDWRAEIAQQAGKNAEGRQKFLDRQKAKAGGGSMH
jgi:hypothetical protein